VLFVGLGPREVVVDESEKVSVGSVEVSAEEMSVYSLEVP
jgi:hypothetical protein